MQFGALLIFRAYLYRFYHLYILFPTSMPLSSLVNVYYTFVSLSPCNNNHFLLSSLSVGTKLGYKLFPLTSIERKLDPSFEKGNLINLLPNQLHPTIHTIHIYTCAPLAISSCPLYMCVCVTDGGEVCIIERLFSSSLVAVVELAHPRKLRACHFKVCTVCLSFFDSVVLSMFVLF